MGRGSGPDTGRRGSQTLDWRRLAMAVTVLLPLLVVYVMWKSQSQQPSAAEIASTAPSVSVWAQHPDASPEELADMLVSGWPKAWDGPMLFDGEVVIAYRYKGVCTYLHLTVDGRPDTIGHVRQPQRNPDDADCPSEVQGLAEAVDAEG